MALPIEARLDVDNDFQMPVTNLVAITFEMYGGCTLMNAGFCNKDLLEY